MLLSTTKVPCVLNKYITKLRMSWKPPESIQKKLKVGWNRQPTTWAINLSL
jgi:hypothetical protein